MKRYRLSAISASLVLILCGCSPFDQPEPESADPGANAADRFDISAYKEKIESLKAIWTQPGHEDDLKTAVPELLRTADEVYASYIRKEIAYYSDWNNDKLTAERDAAYEDLNVVTDMTRWAILNGAKRSEYKEFFSEYDFGCKPDYYLLNNLMRTISYAKQNAAEDTKLLDLYYDAAYGDSTDSEEKNRACAQLYLDILNSTPSTDYDYDAYCRDYTPEDVTAVYEELIPAFQPLYQQLTDALSEADRELPNPGDPMQLLQQYASKLSPEIAESADLLIREKLYTIASGSECYDGSFTVSIPNEQTALMYLYTDGTYLDFTSAVHEFGHFHSERKDSTPVLLQKNCIDLAEVQSQGMEVLYTAFYPEIFGKDANTAELAELFNLTDAVLSGMAVGRFETAVMDKADTLTPDEVLELFDRYCTSCGISLELYEITHLFEQPGYYVSYGVSALPALQLYTMMQEDADAALQCYARISAISSDDGKTGFRQGIKECGMTDIFTPGTVTALAEQLQTGLEQLAE